MKACAVRNIMSRFLIRKKKRSVPSALNFFCKERRRAKNAAKQINAKSLIPLVRFFKIPFLSSAQKDQDNMIFCFMIIREISA